jgi:hypothetical protein
LPLLKITTSFVKQESLKARSFFGLSHLDHVPHDIDGYIYRIGADINLKLGMRQQVGIDACWGSKFKELFFDKKDFESPTSFRWRFTIAHELGHYFLHKDRWASLLDQKAWMAHILKSDAQRNLEEKDANIFAAYFLMPESLLALEFLNILRSTSAIKYSKEGFSDDEIIDLLSDDLAKVFNVTPSCMQIRISNYRRYDRRN